ncbi:unnamed protein product [Protopolystoma xenopodis]|uniref:Uncharacterized protein n=1 Tax=Protopolystoma xenopodis TaxID=117903 RepID=A0A3S5AKK4_9PLAT|nr:unnamed protein product [Protopolystoma xenopodis]
MPAKRLEMYQVHDPVPENILVTDTLISYTSVLTMESFSDDANYDDGETFGNVPRPWSNVRHHEYYGEGPGTRYVPQGLRDAPNKLRKTRSNQRYKAKIALTTKSCCGYQVKPCHY